MRSPLLVVVVLLSVAAAIWMFASCGVADRPPVVPTPAPSPVVPNPASTNASPQEPGPAKPSTGSTAAASGLPPGVEARRTRPADVPEEPLADSPTAWLRIVDHATGAPVVGAPLRRLRGGVELGFSDERGLMALPLKGPEQAAVIVDGYLMRMAPVRLGSTEQEPQELRLVRDEWSFVQVFRFLGPDGLPIAGDVFVRPRLAFTTQPAAMKRSPVPAGDAVLERAWVEHTMIAAQPVCADEPIYLGTFVEQNSMRLADGGQMRFLLACEYHLEAATTSGFVGAADFTVGKGAAPVAVTMQPGSYLSGRVLRAEQKQPLVGATIEVQNGDPLELSAKTGADGTFRIGPLSSREYFLNITHPELDAIAHGPVLAPSDGVEIALRGLRLGSLRGRVRARPALQPLGGATVFWRGEDGRQPVVGKTEADGSFDLRVPMEGRGQLSVQANGHLSYAELVDAGGEPADYDLWPADRAVRVQAGLTAVFEGVVQEADGTPAVGVTVRWKAAEPPAPAPFSGRRVVEGGVLALPLSATTAADGSFRIETLQFGRGRLVLGGAEDQGLDVTAQAGTITDGLRLRR